LQELLIVKLFCHGILFDHFSELVYPIIPCFSKNRDYIPFKVVWTNQEFLENFNIRAKIQNINFGRIFMV
jgi:hypothetical protein